LLDISAEEEERWRDMTSKMTVPVHGDGIISHFEGYGDLQEFDWDGYREKYGNIARLDRILKAENNNPDLYKASKQADFLMLFYILDQQEALQLLCRLGQDLDEEGIRKHIDYYQKRTSHGSTLSKIVFGFIYDRLDRPTAMTFAQDALRSDVEDVQGGTTPEGVHLGVMAGTVDILIREYMGIDVLTEVVDIEPRLPDHIAAASTRILYRGHWLRVKVSHDSVKVAVDQGGVHTVPVRFKGEVHRVAPGAEQELNI
jgi:alpha,alpha-trehalase